MAEQYTSADAADVLHFQIERLVKRLFSHQLSALEDLKQQHDEALGKLYHALPPEWREHVELADYLTDERWKQMRKRVLDSGNETLREIDSNLKHYTINLKEQEK